MPKPVTTALPETQILPDPSLEKRSRRIFGTVQKQCVLGTSRRACANRKTATN